MGENRKLLQVAICLLQIEFAAQERITSAGIDKITSLNFATPLAIAIRWRLWLPDIFPRDVYARRGEIDLLDSNFFPDFGSAFTRMIEQELVEIRSCDLKWMIGLRTVGILEVKFHTLFTTGAEEFAAVFPEKACPIEFSQQVHALERFHAEGE